MFNNFTKKKRKHEKVKPFVNAEQMHWCMLGQMQNRLGPVITLFTAAFFPRSCGLHLGYTGLRLPGSKKMLIPFFLPASLFNFNLFLPVNRVVFC